MALLPSRQRDQILLMVIVLSLGAIGGDFMYMFGDKSQEIATLDTHVAALQAMNDKVKADVKAGGFAPGRRAGGPGGRELRGFRPPAAHTNQGPAPLSQEPPAARPPR